MAAAKSCGQGESEFGLVIQAWMHIDMPLRQDIDEPKDGTSVEDFVNTLLAKQANWYDSYSRNSRSDRFVQRNQQGQYDRGNRGQGNYGRQSSSYPSYPPPRYGNSSYPPRPQWQPNNQPQQFQPRPQGALPNAQLSFKTPLQITSGNERPSPGTNTLNQRFGNQAKKPFNRPNRGNKPPWRGNRGGYGDRAYFAQEANPPEDGPPADDQADYQGFENAYYNGTYQEADMPDIQEGEEAYEPDQEQEPEDEKNEEEAVDVGHVAETQNGCRSCRKTFPSNNKLHKHVRDGCNGGKLAKQKLDKAIQKSKPAKPPGPTLVRSIASPSPHVSTGYGFRGWRYATALAKLALTAKEEPICLDTGCTMSLIDRSFLKEQVPDILIKRTPSPIVVRGLGTGTHRCDEYAVLTIYLPGNNDRLAVIIREVHIVNNLKAKMLVGIDILVPEDISIMLPSRKAIVGSCDDIELSLTVTTRSINPVRKAIMAHENTTIQPRSHANVLIVKTALPQNRDLLFEPDCHTGDTAIYAHIVDHTLSAVQVRNDSDVPLVIPRKTRLGHVVEYEADGCYLVNSQDSELAASTTGKRANWVRTCFRSLLTTATAFHLGMTTSPERKIMHGVTVYGSNAVAAQIATVVHSYPHLWTDRGNLVKVPEEEWMDIPLIDDWKTQYKPGQARVYPVGQKDREVIDTAFDKLQAQGRLEWTTSSTPFTYPCFVVWKNLPDGTRKGRVVVDIRALNKITMPDAYPVPSQADILAAVQGAKYISTVDCSSFFYQWRVKRAHRHRLTVASHRGQETFKVAVMGYWNSPAYVQQMIDRILRQQRPYARAYVDDIVIFSNTLEEHLNHLHNVFGVLDKMGICLSPEKSYLAYPSVQLLGQRVDALGLATSEDKLAAISRIRFPLSLSQLEKYLGLTGYLRQYIPHYAAIVKPLQQRKTFLNQGLRAKGAKGNARKRMAITTRLNEPTPKELNAFHHLQSLFSRPTILVHFSPKRQLYIDLDASKEFGFGAHVYHAKEFAEDGTPKQKSMEPVLFLSRLLQDAETRYWPTELEVAGLVWVVKKTRHMIEAAAKNVIIYTDHAASVGISRQSSLNTTAVEKLNLRLIRASEYLQRFRLDVRYKPGKSNIIPDALSRLPSDNDIRERLANRENQPETDNSILEALQADSRTAAYVGTLVEVSDQLRQDIKRGYAEEPKWERILRMLERNNALGPDAARLPYEIRDGLIFYKDLEKGPRLCIPKSLYGRMFKIAHDDIGHPGYARTHERLTDSLYLYDLSKNLHEYIQHCPQCQLSQTPRHKPYGALQPIITPPRPFHTLTIDFILALPLSKPDKYNTIMSVTDKFSKAITLIPGRDTMTAEDWAIALLDRLALLNWGLPRAIISDRDRKFLASLWKGVFKQLKVDLLYSSAYHPQTDGSSEATNQTAEIALRYWLMTLKEPDLWPFVLARLQAALNNSTKYSSTRLSPNQVIFGMRTREAMDLLRVEEPDTERIDSNHNGEQVKRKPVTLTTMDQYRPAHIDAKDAIAYAAMAMKYYYDRKHKPLYFKVGDLVNLRLHKGYTLPSLKEKK